MNKIEQANLVVTEFESLQKNVELVVNELFPELRISKVADREALQDKFIERARKTLTHLKRNVSILEELLEEPEKGEQ